ncbi:RHS repeat-associated core domain-containing protein [Spirochaeta lutea]
MTSLVYDERGREIARLLPNGVVTERDYDAAGQLRAIRDLRPPFGYDSDISNWRQKLREGFNDLVFGNSEGLFGWMDSWIPPGLRKKVLDELPFNFPGIGHGFGNGNGNGPPPWAGGPGGPFGGGPPPWAGPKIAGEAYVYDAAGKRTQMIDYQGHVTSYSYDDAGRLETVRYPIDSDKPDHDLEMLEDFGVNPDGEDKYTHAVTLSLDTATEQLLSTLFEYLGSGGNDGIEESFNQYQEQWQESFVYDANGNRTQWETGFGSIGYEYNERDQLKVAGLRSYEYDPKGNLTKETLGARYVTYAYNFENRVIDIFTYNNDLIGSGPRPETYGVRYAYDALGRRTRTSPYTGQPVGLHNEPSPDQSVTLSTLYAGLGFEELAEFVSRESYNPFGTDLQKEFRDTSETRHNYQNYGRTKYFGENLVRSEMIYANGRILQMTDFGDLAYPFPPGHVWAMEGLWDDWSEQPNPYFYDSSENIEIQKAYYSHNVLGSVRMITGVYGDIREKYAYDAYGNTYEGNFHRQNPFVPEISWAFANGDGVHVPALRNANQFGYNSKRYDTLTGAYDYGFRNYRTDLGRWTTIDPIKDGANWYGYVGNDPVNFVDPLGLETQAFSIPVVLGARHIFIAVKDEETGEVTTRGLYPDSLIGVFLDIDHTSSVLKDEQRSGADEYGAAMAYFSGGDLPDGYRYEGEIFPPEGISQQTFDERILEEADSYEEKYNTQESPLDNDRPYYLIGPNSNTAADDWVENAGGIMPDVEGAWGQNWGESSGLSPKSSEKCTD